MNLLLGHQARAWTGYILCLGGGGGGGGDAGEASPAVVNLVLGAVGKYFVLNTISIGVLQFWLWFNFGCFSYIGG